MKSICQNLSKIWFLIISSCVHGFTIWNSITKYIRCKELAFSLKYGDKWNLLPLNLYLLCIIVSIALFLLTFYTTLKQNGHWANDGVMITSDYLKSKNLIHKNEKYYSQFYIPFHMMMYFFSAVVIWIPISWINGEIIKNGATTNNDDLWSMELGFLFSYGQRFSLKLDAESKELYHLLPAWKTFQEIVQGYYPNNKTLVGTILMSLQPVALGGLGQLPQTQDQIHIVNMAKNLIVESGGNQQRQDDYLLVNPKISYELINVFVAGIFLTVRLSSVFCLTSKLFTIISSVLLSMSILEMIFESILFSLILKLSACFSKSYEEYENMYRLDSLSLDSLQIIRIFISLIPQTIFSLIIGNIILNIFLLVTFYEYGVKQFYNRFYQNNQYTSEIFNGNSHNQGYTTAYENGYTKVMHNFKYTNKLTILYRKKLIQVIGLFLLFVKMAILVPMLIEALRLYVKRTVPQILFTVIFCLATNLLWMLVWFCLLIKNNLNFKMKSTLTTCKSYNQSINFNNSTIPRTTPNEIYYHHQRNSIHLANSLDFDHVLASGITGKACDFNLYSCINPNLTVTPAVNGHHQHTMTKSFNYFDTSTLNNNGPIQQGQQQRSPKSLMVKSKSNYNCNVYDLTNLEHQFIQMKHDANESDDSHGSSNVPSNDSGFINNSIKNSTNVSNNNTSFCYNDFIGSAKYMNRKMVGDDISRNYSELYHTQRHSLEPSSNNDENDLIPSKMPLILDPIPINGILQDQNTGDLDRICSQV